MLSCSWRSPLSSPLSPDEISYLQAETDTYRENEKGRKKIGRRREGEGGRDVIKTPTSNKNGVRVQILHASSPRATRCVFIFLNEKKNCAGEFEVEKYARRKDKGGKGISIGVDLGGRFAIENFELMLKNISRLFLVEGFF